MKRFRLVMSITLFFIAIGIGATVAQRQMRSIRSESACICHTAESSIQHANTLESSVLTPAEESCCPAVDTKEKTVSGSSETETNE